MLVASLGQSIQKVERIRCDKKRNFYLWSGIEIKVQSKKPKEAKKKYRFQALMKTL